MGSALKQLVVRGHVRNGKDKKRQIAQRLHSVRSTLHVALVHCKVQTDHLDSARVQVQFEISYRNIPSIGIVPTKTKHK